MELKKGTDETGRQKSNEKSKYACCTKMLSKFFFSDAKVHLLISSALYWNNR